MTTDFVPFNKIPRFSRDIVITEKIDGTNGCIFIDDNGNVRAGSRNRWITPEDDNFGFARWVMENSEELSSLGPGRHYGEWWGSGIQRGYGLSSKKFSLFNVGRWNENNVPSCCNVVPVLYIGPFHTYEIDKAISRLRALGSVASPGFLKPEGIIIYHSAGNVFFKKTLEKDDQRKS